MKTPWYFAFKYVKIGLLSIAVLLASCNTLKRVGENELLLSRNNVFTDQEKIKNPNVEGLILQEPNTTLLGYPLR